jgi:hypothetical protein
MINWCTISVLTGDYSSIYKFSSGENEPCGGGSGLVGKVVFSHDVLGHFPMSFVLLSSPGCLSTSEAFLIGIHEAM